MYPKLTHWGLLTTYGDVYLSQHWTKKGSLPGTAQLQIDYANESGCWQFSVKGNSWNCQNILHPHIWQPVQVLSQVNRLMATLKGQ